MHHLLSSGKSSYHSESAKPHRFPRFVATLALIALGVGISIHLFAIHVSYWWLPLIVALALGHVAIIGGLAWLVTRHGHAEHKPGEHGHVLHNPRAYDWLVRVIMLGGERKFRRRILGLAELKPGDSVLDVGCGTGTLLIEAAKRVGPSGSAHGIDASAEMLAHARSKATVRGVTATFVEGSSDNLAFPDASFDAVFCTLMLHHLPIPMQTATVEEMRRVLRPGGRIVIVDMQRPRKISAVLSRLGFVHLFRSAANLADWKQIEKLLTERGVRVRNRQAMWGETVCALVGVNRANKVSAPVL